MGLKPPSSRRKKLTYKLDLVPIMDAIFIFIFFLLFSAQFIKIYEIHSDAPILSNSPPPENKKEPLLLTLKIQAMEIIITSGTSQNVIKKISKDGENYNLLELHDFMIQTKLKNLSEDTVIFEPSPEVSYEEIIKIMDEVRVFRKTDESIYLKDKEGLEHKLKYIWEKIVFGNLMS